MKVRRGLDVLMKIYRHVRLQETAEFPHHFVLQTFVLVMIEYVALLEALKTLMSRRFTRQLCIPFVESAVTHGFAPVNNLVSWNEHVDLRTSKISVAIPCS